VTPQTVALAKTLVLRAAESLEFANEIFAYVLKAQHQRLPNPIQISRSHDSSVDIRALAELCSCVVSVSEAILSLLSTGCLVPTNAGHYPPEVSTVFVTSGHHVPCQFKEYSIVVPSHLRIAYSGLGAKNQFLVDPDLYLQTFAVPNMHAEVASALREAVNCFRYEYFTAAVAMLGKASESAWIELGISLLRVLEQSERAAIAKQRDALHNPMIGTMKKIEAVTQLYGRQSSAGIVASSNIKPDELGRVPLWSDIVRDSRNNLHFGVQPVTPNTRDKVAELLLATPKNLKILYAIKQAADACP
jgi:hypothetical protein